MTTLYVVTIHDEGAYGSDAALVLGVFTSEKLAEEAREKAFAQMLRETCYDNLSPEEFAVFPFAFGVEPLELDEPKVFTIMDFPEVAAEIEMGGYPEMAERLGLSRRPIVDLCDNRLCSISHVATEHSVDLTAQKG